MVKPAPQLDSRTAATIARQVRLLLQPTPEGQGLVADPDLALRSSQGMSAALIGVFARYCEIIIQRLNQVPDKNFLAFLNLLGASRLPPQPARVPLTFTLAAGSTVDAVVPAGTQVAAPPVEGDQDPVIFETEQEIVVSAAQCVSLWVREAAADRYSDRSTILATTDEQGVAPFLGKDDLPHLLYIGHDRLFGFTFIHQLDLIITLAQPNSECEVVWEIWNSDAEQWQEIMPDSPADSTAPIRNLQESGTLRFTNLTALAAVAVNGQEHRWLRCRLTKRITPKSTAEADQIRVSQLPTITNLQLQVRLEQADLVAEAAFANQFAVDASQVFFPFGEKPALGDVFYLAHREAFAQNGAEVTLNMTILDPVSAGITDSNAPDGRALEPELTWEFWDGKLWQLIGTTTRRNVTRSIEEDSTQAFLQAGESGIVKFRLSETPATTTINGVENYWIRVRISGGNYGREARYVPTGMEPATFRPPIISNLKITYAITIPSQSEPPERPEYLIQYNDFAYAPVDPATNFTPFQPTADLAPQPHPRLYLGFSLPANRPAFPNQPLSLYIRTADYSPADLTSSPTGDRPQITWQYWQGQAWRKLTVRDSSENFTRPGLLEFLPPADLAAKAEFGLTPRYWLRVAWESGDYPFRPRLRRLLNNTTLAAQTITITAETLGSSNGTEQQVFYTTRSPVLAGQHLQVREPELPSTQEQSIIQQEEGEGAIAAIRDGTGRPQEVWVRWHEVSDFYGSGPRDRHYTLNRLTGEIQFGDGLNGLIPPIGISNLRMNRYQTGGGSRGNCSAHTIVQLKTTVPYVEKVTNPEAATGGAAAESLEFLVERMPRTIRHRGRAVTLQDYEDLAKLAASEVARAKCVPLRNLQIADPTATEPGTLSVIVVPHSPSPRPLPSLELLQRVEHYLQMYSALTAKVAVLAPQYLSVNVNVELAVISLDGASAVEQAVERQLSNFLHPLTGGLDGTGWGFGREPYRSDFYRQIESVPGVDHVRSLQVELVADTPGLQVAAIQQTGLFLVYSGQHTIDLVFEES